MEQNRKKQLINQSNEACSSMIVGVRQLRLSVLDLFTTLADNGPDPNRNLQLHQENLFNNSNKLYHEQNLHNLATSHTICTSSTLPIRIEKQRESQQQLDLLQYVNQMISSIATTIRNLDQDILILMQNNSLINIGESVNLAMDCSLEKHNLYMDLCKSYKTYAKLHDYSAHCHALLHQQSLKRVHKKFETTNISSSTGIGAIASAGSAPSSQSKDIKADSIVATFNPYIYRVCSSKSSIMNILETCLKMCEYMDGTYLQPFGVSTGVFQISVNRVLKAVLVMRGIVIDAVIVKAYHESFSSEANKTGSSAGLLAAEAGGSPFVDPDEDIDLWSESKYAVFRKLTHHANAAVLHFQYPTYPEIAVRSFLVSFSHHQSAAVSLHSRFCCTTVPSHHHLFHSILSSTLP